MRRGWLGIAAVLYLGASLALQWRALPAFGSTTIGRTSTDPTGFTWWLAHLPHALASGTNPLLTDLQHYPAGVNAMWNTSVPLLAVLLAPVTLTAGATAAFNTGMVLGPVVSGVLAAWALGGIVRSRTGRVLAGALYAFSPFMLAHLQAGHLNLVWAVFPPVLLALAHRLFVRELTRPWLLGALTGLACALQALLYTQTLTLGVLVFVVLAVFLGAWRRVVPLLKAGLACVVTFGVLAAYPVYLVVAGPGRPQAHIRASDYGSADLGNTLAPTWLTLFRPVTASPAMTGNVGEQGGYLGVVVLLLVLVAVLTCGRPARVAAAVGAVTWVLSLGVDVYLDGQALGVRMPWRLVRRVPLLAEIEPVRLQVVVGLAVAVLVGLVVDRAVDGFTARRLAGAGAAVLAAAAVVTWLPADAQRTTPAPAPAYPQLAAQVVETWPRITGNWYGGADPLRAQIASGFSYRLVGGYFIGSDATNPILIESPWNLYQQGAALTLNAVGGGIPGPLGLPTPDPAAAAADLRARGVTRVLVTVGPDAAPVLDWTRRVTGDDPVPLDGAWAFTLRG